MGWFGPDLEIITTRVKNSSMDASDRAPGHMLL